MKKAAEMPKVQPPTDSRPRTRRPSEITFTNYENVYNEFCNPVNNESFDAAERVVDQILSKWVFIVKDKELVSKTMPYTTCYTMTLLSETVDMRVLNRDYRDDDRHLKDATDSEEPFKPAIDNLAVARQRNKSRLMEENERRVMYKSISSFSNWSSDSPRSKRSASKTQQSFKKTATAALQSGVTSLIPRTGSKPKPEDDTQSRLSPLHVIQVVQDNPILPDGTSLA